MWTCKECDTRNQDGDRFCACCGAAAPIPQAPRPTASGASANAPGERQTAAQGGTQNTRPSAAQGAGSYTLPTAPKKPFPVAALVVVVAVALLLGWRFFTVATKTEQRYTADTAPYTDVYADIVSLEPVTTVNYGKKDSVVKEPRYVVCRCDCEDQSTFLMIFSIEEYQRFDSKTQFTAFGILPSFVGDGKVHFDPARRFHGSVQKTKYLHDGVLTDLGETIVTFTSADS